MVVVVITVVVVVIVNNNNKNNDNDDDVHTINVLLLSCKNKQQIPFGLAEYRVKDHHATAVEHPILQVVWCVD